MFIIVLVTIPSKYAKKLAKTLLEKRLVACVNIIKGVESYFWWEDKLDYAKESLLIMKTQNKLFSKIKKEIENIHPYSVCEIIGINIDKINKKYANWLLKETCGK